MALFGWVRREQGGGPGREWVAALRTAVQHVGGDEGVVDHVLTGRDPAVLARVPVQSWYSVSTRELHPKAAALRTLYAGARDVDAAVLRRWGHVLDRVHGAASWGLVLGPVAGCRWPELMIGQAGASTRASEPLPLTFDDLARVAAVDGATPADLLTAVFTVQGYQGHVHGGSRAALVRMPGLADALTAHRDLVTAALTVRDVEGRLAALDVVGLTLTDDALVDFVEPLAVGATASSAQVRGAAQAVLDRTGPAAVPPLRALAVSGRPDARARALDLLAERPDEYDWAVATAGADRAESVRSMPARWEAERAAEAAHIPEALPDAPPPTRWGLPRPDAEAVARAVVGALATDVAEANRRRAAYARAQGGSPRQEPVPGATEVAALTKVLASTRPPVPGSARARPDDRWALARALTTAASRGDVDATSAVALLVAAGLADQQSALVMVLQAVHARSGEPDLLGLQQMLDEAGLDGRTLVWTACVTGWISGLARGWPDEHVWPFVARNLGWVLEQGRRDGWYVQTTTYFRMLATLPTPPARLVEHLYDLALRGRKTDREPAQRALAGDPQRAQRAAAALLDGRSESRLVAAQWLVEIADPAAVPALRAAWDKEKQDVVRGALLDALLAAGEDAETYLDPAATTATAEAYVAKGLPAPLAWVAWDTVPEVRWASSGESVPRAVVQWLCGTAVKARSPEPNAILRHYAVAFEPESRRRLAHHLLQTWLTEDVRPVPADEAERSARQTAAGSHRWLTAPGSQYEGLSVDELYARLLPAALRAPAGSAIASKGLLAVVAACGGREVVAPTERFLREWFGQRAAQGKALIAMLAWVDDPAAVQLVLSVGSRFRTKSFQEEAVRQAQALADRKGWTVDELADRTVPTAGFGDDGVLTLSYGPRTFTARLLPDLTVELRDPDGTVVKALPAPRRTDDADLAADAKKAFAAARKDVKAIATLQQRRLYEALCTERSWSADDWDRYLLRHPVLGLAVRRLVWVATVDDQEPVVFRPLDDGSLTGVDDEPVELPEGARVRLAHDSVLDPAAVARWVEHLADYEVTPLFPQLGRGVHALPADAAGRRELDDFTGHVLEAFALRGRALRLGWTRGETVDGGWFLTYDKRFPTLGVVARIEFTGNSLPEENRTVALRTLSFHRSGPDGQGEVGLTVGEVPAVLVSECWHDLRVIAAEGTGFDPDWEKRTAGY